MSTSFRRQAKKMKEKLFHLNPVNNRKATRGRLIQVDPKTGRQIRHRI